MKKRRKFFILLKIILIIVLIYAYITDEKTIYISEIYRSLGEVLGGFRNVLIPYLILNILSDFILDLNKRMVFLIRLNFIFVFFICLSNLQLLFYVADLEKNNLDKNVFRYLYVDKNLGMLVTMFLYKFYFLVSFNINIWVTGTILFFSSFILFGKIVGNIVRKILKYYSKESREKRKEIKKLIKEKKRIKKQILKKEKQERIESKKQYIIEKTKEKQRKQRILKLKNEIDNKKKISMGKQLNIKGIDIVHKGKSEEKKIDIVDREKLKEKDKAEEVTEQQLHFKFKKEEV